ncbi:MAG: T9SS type A sorting domain-containing protein [Vicingaceae bacterium]
MFKYLVGFSLILFSFNINGQYKSLFSSNDTWNVYNVQYFPVVDSYVDSIYLGDSVTINSQRYATLKSKFYDANLSFPYGYVREDTTIGKAWYLPDSLNLSSEQLIYDLSLVKNDTFIVDSGATELLVDTSYLLNNRQILKLVLLNNDSFELQNVRVTPQTKAIYKYDTLLFIEGIGTTKGFDNRTNSGNSRGITGSSHRLLCVFDTNQVKVFQHQLTPIVPFLLDCDTVHLGGSVGLNEHTFPYKIEIFPNPADDIITIRYLKGVKQIKLYNSIGQKIQEMTMTPIKSNSTQVILPNEPGIYFIHFEIDDGSTESRKLIKL